jgi:hypothetical protein
VRKGLEPPLPGQLRDDPAKEAVTEVGVVESLVTSKGKLLVGDGGHQRVQGATRVALPPEAVRFPLKPGGMAEQLPQPYPGQAAAGKVLRDRVVEVESPLGA